MKKGLLKHIFNTANDVVLLGMIVVVMGVSIWGLKPSFRNLVLDSGSYQIEPFPFGLSIHQFGRVSPFYTFSIKDDYVVVDGEKNNLIPENGVIEDLSDFEKVKLGIGSYLGVVRPSISYELGEVRVSYEGREEGDGLLVSKKIVFENRVMVEKNVMIISFGDNEIVFDGVSGQDLTGINDVWRYKVNRYYRYLLKSDGVLSSRMLVKSGVVKIINPLIPGYLEIVVDENQRLYVNRKNKQIEVVEEVEKKEKELTMSVLVRGSRIGEDK